MTDTPLTSRLSGKALASVLLAVTGPLSLFLGILALKDINWSDGRLRGRRLAVAGLIAGAAATVALALGAVALIMVELRQRAARADCQNNLRQIGEALNRFYDQQRTFPAGTVANAGLAPDKRLSWYVSILPYLTPDPRQRKSREQRLKDWEALCQGMDLTQAWDAQPNRPWVATPISWFHCPADPSQAPPGAPALTSYVGIAGVGKDAALLPADAPNAGLFGYDRVVKREQVTAGISQAMMVAETGWENGLWAAGGFATVRGVDPMQQPYLGRDRPFGGLHPGGLFVLYVDGSARWVSDTVGPQVFLSMATIQRDK